MNHQATCKTLSLRIEIKDEEQTRTSGHTKVELVTMAKLACLNQHHRLVLQRRAKVAKLAPLAMGVAVVVVDLIMVGLKQLHQCKAHLCLLKTKWQRTPLPRRKRRAVTHPNLAATGVIAVVAAMTVMVAKREQRKTK